MERQLTFGEALIEAIKGKSLRRLSWKRETSILRISEEGTYMSLSETPAITFGDNFCITKDDILAKDWVII